jgi:hypothetical protein
MPQFAIPQCQYQYQTPLFDDFFLLFEIFLKKRPTKAEKTAE